MSQLDAETARAYLKYDPETGDFRWRIRRAQMAPGSVAGHVQVFSDRRLYLMIRVNDRLYGAHRLAWLIMTGHLPQPPFEEVDHRNCNSMDNRWANLRLATRQQNSHNVRRRSDNTSGFKGVSFDNFTGRWVARIRVYQGKYENLGRFDTPDDAAKAYALRAAALHGSFVRTG